MANRGRPRKPKAQKILEGTYRKDFDYDGLQAPVLSEIPEYPTHLNEECGEYFKNICGELLKMGLLATSDILVISQLAEVIYLQRKAFANIEKTGGTQTTKTGYNSVDAHYSIYKDTSKQIRELSNMLGLNPAAREKIRNRDTKKEEDDLQKLLKQ